jgi:translocation and assembly module TamB
LAAPAWAQDDDSGGLLVGFLEDNLSGENRYIKVTGLEGAFSSRATIKQLTVSDDKGVWLTLNNAELDWNRLALVRGRFSVNALSADEIILSRPPNAVATDPSLPSPEAQPFQLPEIPVSIELGKISIKRFELGKPVMGIAAELEMTGALTLAEGALDTHLNILRLDRPGDAVFLVAKFENETSMITLDLAVIEDQGGLIATALHIPDGPPLKLIAKGEGPVNDFTADINLSTDGINRVAGQVRLQEVPAPDNSEDAKPGVAFTVDIGGDVTPLLAPDYQPFFGANSQVDLVGQRDADGRFEISRFEIDSDALTLSGSLNIAASGEIEKILLQGRIAPRDGNSVVLPLTGPRTEISALELSARLDVADNDNWELALSLEGLSRPGMSFDKVQIQADGTLLQVEQTQIQGQFEAQLGGVEFDDSDLDQAVGEAIALAGQFALQGDGALKLSQVELRGEDYSAALDGQLQGLESGFQMRGTARVGAADLSRFSGLAGQSLGGAITASIEGNGAPLGGQFDFKFDARAENLSSGIAQIDPLIGGQTTVSMDAARSTTGLKINSFRMDGQALSARASGALSSSGSDLEFEAKLNDLALVLPEVSGPLNLRGNINQDTGGTLTGKLRLDGPQSSFADLTGAVHPNGTAKLEYSAELDRIERFVPEMSGTISSAGTAQRDGTTWRIDGDANAPAGFSAKIGGTWDEKSGLSHLNAAGEVQLAAVNKLLKPNSIVGVAKFDLALDGQPSLSGISGTITTNGAKFVLPGVAQTIDNINTKVSLEDGQATLAMTAALAAGGTFRVSGPITLAPPFQGTITTDLQQIILTDNVSFTSVADGRLVYSGPLTGNANLSGQINFGDTEINLNTASGSIGAAPIPTITHRGATNAEQATRARAGLVKTDGGASGPVIGLDIVLSAPNRVFARGRGVQAELGGQIQVRGTTAQVIPSGQIELIRGNMNLLGRNLKLTRGLVSLQGKLEPYVEFAAVTSTSEGTAGIEISGPLGSPKVEVTSDPERPSEEALAMLIFGNRFAEMSPLAIAQLAASLAELSGKGGGTAKKAREGLGVDTLDVGTDDSGAGQVGVGLYVLDNVYTDFSVNTQGDTELNLNLDVSENFTVKGTVDNTGSTSVGVFFNRDY